MTTVDTSRPSRIWSAPALTTGSFSDIAPGCQSVEWLPNGGISVTFAGDLTADQRLRVQIRCVAVDAAQEQILIAAAQAYIANLDYLALPVPTTAQAIAQVRALTQQINGVLRFVTGL